MLPVYTTIQTFSIITANIICGCSLKHLANGAGSMREIIRHINYIELTNPTPI